MGSGSSKKAAEPGATGATSSGRASVGGKKDEFTEYLDRVFARADRDNSGSLDRDELKAVLFSKKLGLNLNEEEAEKIIRAYDADGQGEIDYHEFSGLLKHLLQLVQSAVDTNVNDWAMLKDDDSGKVIYINKRTGKSQKTKPLTFNEERVEYLDYETRTLPNGDIVTVRTSENGTVEFCDFQTGSWKPISEAESESESDHLGNTYNGFPIGYQQHKVYPPVYDDDQGNTKLVPLKYTMENIPEVKHRLADLENYFPDMKGSFLSILALEYCGFDMGLTSQFIEVNKLSSIKAPIPDAETEIEKSKDEKIAALEAKVVALEAEKHAAVDTAAESQRKLESTRDEMDQHAERVRRLTSRVDISADAAKSVGTESNDAVVELEAKNAALEAKIATLTEALESAATTAPVPEGSVPPAASTGSDGGTAASDLRAAQDTAAAQKSKIVELTKKVSDLTAELAAAQAMTKKATSGKDSLSKSFNLFKSDLIEMKGKNAELKEQMKTMISAVSPLVKDGLAEARGLNAKVADANKELVAKYQKEQKLRKKYYNEVQELKGNIRVFVRVRKDNRGAYKGGGVFKFVSDTECTVDNVDPNKPRHKFEFAKVYACDSKQEQVFEDTKATLMSVVDGYNVCIMAYGQTGSGKTFTMMGPPDMPGVNRRAISELLQKLDDAKGDIDFQLEASQIEVYNEGIYDLLNMGPREETKIKPRIAGKVVELPGLNWRSVSTLDDVEKVMTDGDKNRSVACTAMNSASSRSHLVLQLRVTSINKATKAKTRATLTLVDLAGSERVSKSEVSGNGLLEAAAINKSLSALGQVFMSLAKGDPHVPYRNSALTIVLAESLGGNAKCCMFANASPLESNLSETISTLKFANNITKIELGSAKKQKKQ